MHGGSVQIAGQGAALSSTCEKKLSSFPLVAPEHELATDCVLSWLRARESDAQAEDDAVVLRASLA